MQVGAYTGQQGADRSTLIGSNPALAAYAAFANYLSAAGRLDLFEKLAPGIFRPAELDQVLIF